MSTFVSVCVLSCLLFSCLSVILCSHSPSRWLVPVKREVFSQAPACNESSDSSLQDLYLTIWNEMTVVNQRYICKKTKNKNVTCIWYKLWWNKNKDGRKVWEGKEKGLKTHNMLPGHLYMAQMSLVSITKPKITCKYTHLAQFTFWSSTCKVLSVTQSVAHRRNARKRWSLWGVKLTYCFSKTENMEAS